MLLVRDPIKEMVTRGLAVLGEDKANRTFLFGLSKRYGGPDRVLKAIKSCEETDPIDPKSWMVACLQQKPKQRSNSVEDVLKQSGLTARMAQWFVNDVLKPAKSLHLIDMDNDGALAKALAELYMQVKYARDLASLPPEIRRSIDGPLALVQRYMAWLAERDWDASSKVLMMDSPAFGQFRRDYARLEGRDPITGHHRYRD